MSIFKEQFSDRDVFCLGKRLWHVFWEAGILCGAGVITLMWFGAPGILEEVIITYLSVMLSLLTA